MQKTYIVSADFKNRVTAILSSKKFTAVFSLMNLINREDNVYTEQELNAIIQFLGELPYVEVVEFFNLVPTMVAENKQPLGAEPEQSASQQEAKDEQTTA